MHRITWLIEQFQFTYRQLAKMLHVSPSLVHLFQNDKRNLPVRNQALLDHPLFAPYPIREEMALLPEPEWEDPDKEIRILETQMRRNLLFLEKRKASSQLEAIKERRLVLHRVLYHTRDLPFSYKGGESLIEMKWIVLKIDAREEIESLTVAERRKLEKKIFLLDAEMKLMDQWLEEDKGPGSAASEGLQGNP
jgi:hypothetical protein